MSESVEVKMGGLEIIDDDTNELKTFVGSCVAICLFDTASKVAGMAHVMLPRKNNDLNSNKDLGKYADKAFEHLLNNLVEHGADLKRIQAKMAGGATIFAHESETNMFNVGPRNVMALKQILKENNIPLISEDTGLNFGRWVKFHLDSGKMIVTSKMMKSEKII